MAGFNRFPLIAALLKPALQAGITTTALELAANAADLAPVETGFLADSIYSVTPDGGNTYGNAGSPPGDSYLLPLMPPPDDMTGIVAVAANYGAFVNYGTRFQAAQPFFDIAVELARSTLESKLKIALDKGLPI
jgi:hypothetical protein